MFLIFLYSIIFLYSTSYAVFLPAASGLDIARLSEIANDQQKLRMYFKGDTLQYMRAFNKAVYAKNPILQIALVDAYGASVFAKDNN